MTNPADELQLLTTKEVATMLAMSTKTLRDLVRNGEIAFIATGNGKLRRRMAFHPRDVADFVNRRRMRETPVRGPKTVNVAGTQPWQSYDFMEQREHRISERKRLREEARQRAARSQ